MKPSEKFEASSKKLHNVLLKFWNELKKILRCEEHNIIR